MAQLMLLNLCRLNKRTQLAPGKSPQERLDKWLNSRSESIYDDLRTPENGIQHGRLSMKFASKDVE